MSTHRALELCGEAENSHTQLAIHKLADAIRELAKVYDGYSTQPSQTEAKEMSFEEMLNRLKGVPDNSHANLDAILVELKAIRSSLNLLLQLAHSEAARQGR